MDHDDGKPTDGTIDFQKKKNEKQAKQKKPKILPGELQRQISDVLSGDSSFLPALGLKLHVYRHPDGKTETFEEYETGIVRKISEEKISHHVVNYCAEKLGFLADYCITERQAKGITQHWILISRSLKEYPEAFVEKDDPRLAFSRLKFNYAKDTSLSFIHQIYIKNIESKSMPVQDDWLDIFFRASDWKSLACFIGSLTFEKSDRQQYLYLYGQGRNGKGSLVRLLARLLGPAYHADDPTLGNGNRFWTHSFIGKRLVVFPDANTPTFAQTGLFKSLTGDDAVRVEQKGGKTFTTDLQCKFIFLSNEQLQISSNDADMRRAVFVELSELGQNTKILSRERYDHLLDLYAENFINFCRAMYVHLCPDFGPIPVDKQQLEDLAQESEEGYEGIFEDRFAIEDGHRTRATDLKKYLRFTEVTSTKEIGKFKLWMKRTKGIDKIRVTQPNGKREWVYERLRFILPDACKK